MNATVQCLRSVPELKGALGRWALDIALKPICEDAIIVCWIYSVDDKIDFLFI
jgi:hypothetical protein